MHMETVWIVSTYDIADSYASAVLGVFRNKRDAIDQAIRHMSNDNSLRRAINRSRTQMRDGGMSTELRNRRNELESGGDTDTYLGDLYRIVELQIQ